MWHEERLLIDGELVAAEGGRAYETVSPSTEEALGVAADASVGDVQRAIAAARRAFDTTDWSRDVALRQRCLRQLHQALVANKDKIADILVHEVGSPRSIIDGAQLGGPTAVVKWHGDLLPIDRSTPALGTIDGSGSQQPRCVEKGAAGVVAGIT